MGQLLNGFVGQDFRAKNCAACRVFGQDPTEWSSDDSADAGLLKYSLTNAPKVLLGNTFAPTQRKTVQPKGATLSPGRARPMYRRLPANGLKPLPTTGQSWHHRAFFHQGYGAGPIHRGHLRDVALQRCDKLPQHCPKPLATQLAAIMPLC
ncbi:hypothetical protein KY380_05460 [Pseudomonas sp. HD6421]|uniref:hypothetical protein n=1 Tax=Pseudomonas sp. HD6421 TaxID=2860319 RepID=UPI0021BA80D9|nr:hypothetical protein [Pseudomonas sp. HD6421]MCT8182199.1 hypothetical protein [Pseudomonas sp. HD6421]